MINDIKEIVVVALPNVKVRIQWITIEGVVVHETLHSRPVVRDAKQGLIDMEMEMIK